MLARIDAVLGFDRATELSRIKAPTLVMTAADDIVIPFYFSEALARAIPQAELKVFPRGGHSFNRVVRREFNHALQRFLVANTPAG
jgi:aminoacrylate hydrolase